MKGTLVAIGLIALLIFVSGGLDKTSTGPGLNRPRNLEKPEYDCLKHAKDGICEVPVNDKVVLYCVKPPFKRVVRYREDCK